MVDVGFSTLGLGVGMCVSVGLVYHGFDVGIGVGRLLPGGATMSSKVRLMYGQERCK